MHAIRFARTAGPLLVALLVGACSSDEPPVITPLDPPSDLTPRIEVFGATPSTIDAGDPATLRWRTHNVKSLALVDGAGTAISLADLSVDEGSIDVRPLATTSYTLTATGPDASVGPSERVVTVAVREQPGIPAIVEFKATPKTVARGSEVALSWKTTGATVITIKDDAGTIVDLGSALAEQGQVQVKPTRLSTTYTLVADGPGGRDTEAAEVTVADLPRVVQFDISPLSPVHAGGTATLNWVTSDATSVVIKRDGVPLADPSPGLTGSRTFTLSENAVFTLAATNDVGTVDARAEAKVGPRIVEFSSSAWLVWKEEEITLRWELDDADRATIEGPGRDPILIEGDDVASGSVAVTMTQSGDFVLRAFRGDVSRTSVVSVDITTTPIIRSFRPERSMVSAANDIAGSVILLWDQVGGDTCTIYRSNLPVPGHENVPCEPQGTAEIPVYNSGRLRLEVRNGDRIAPATTDITARRPSSVVSFTATPARRLTPGDPVTLAWEVEDAVSVGIAVKDGPPLDIDPSKLKGTHKIDEVFSDTTYVLTATNELDDAFTAEVIVGAGAPKLLEVTLTPSYLIAGTDTFTISWKADGGDLLTVTKVGEVEEELLRVGSDNLARIDSGSLTLTSPATPGKHQYKVRVEDTRSNLFDESEILEFDSTDGPILQTLTADSTEVTYGGSTTLRWTRRLPTGVTASQLSYTLENDCGGTPTAPGSSATSTSVTPPQPPPEGFACTYTLTVGVTGRMSSSRSVTVNVKLPLNFNSFTATPSSIRNDDGTADDGVVLSWATQNGSELEIFKADAAGNVTSAAIYHEDDPAKVAAGSFKVYPTTASRYLARLRNVLDAVVEKWVTVVVDPPVLLEFVANPDTIVQGEPSTLTWKAKTAEGVWVGPSMPEITRLGNTYVDISGFGTAHNPGSSTAPFTLNFTDGFVFPFRGTNRTSIRVSQRGWAGFNTSAAEVNDALQMPSATRNVVFALYQGRLDYHNGTGNPDAKIYYGKHTDSLGECFIIQWHHRSRQDYQGDDDFNFQLVLRPNGNFEYRYGTMTSAMNETWPGINAGLNMGIGFQYDDATWPGANLVPFKAAAEGGLANTGWAFNVVLPSEGSMEVKPSSTTTYTATAFGQGVTDPKNAKVTVWLKPTITSASVPAEVNVGQQFSITWSGINNVTSTRVLRGDGSVVCPTGATPNGSCQVTEYEPGIKAYYIELINGPAYNVVEYWLATDVRDAFGIDDFTVSPTQFPMAGETVTLSWVSQGAVSAEIQGCEMGVYPTCTVLTNTVNPDSDSYESLPLYDTIEFKLKICDMTYQCEVSSIVVYIGIGSLDTLEASPTTISRGDSTTLSWTSTDQDYVKFDTLITPIEVADEFITLSSPGATQATLIGDVNRGYYDVVFPGGFTFPWFGEKKTGLRASTDGWLTFDMEFSGEQNERGTSTPTNGLPTKSDTTPIFHAVQFAPFWTNMAQSAGRPLRYQLFSAGDARCGGNGERCLAIEWGGFVMHEPDPLIAGQRRCTPDGTKVGADLNIQVVLFESGMFDFRYGKMFCEKNPDIAAGGRIAGSSGTTDTVIGWQGTDHYDGQMLVARRTPMPNGLEDRSWRFPVQMAANGSITLAPTATTTYRLCASNASYYPDCMSVTVTVN